MCTQRIVVVQSTAAYISSELPSSTWNENGISRTYCGEKKKQPQILGFNLKQVTRCHNFTSPL